MRWPSFEGPLFARLFEEGSLKVFDVGGGNSEHLLKSSQ